MRAINHALGGALIGLTVTNPWIAAPLAVGSHFLLDAVPHFGWARDDYNSRSFNIVLVIDTLLCVLIVTLLAATRPAYWMAAIVCAFLATAPDFMWISKYLRTRRGQHTLKPRGILLFHTWIQWFQRPPGAIVEIVFFIGAIFLLVSLIGKI